MSEASQEQTVLANVARKTMIRAVIVAVVIVAGIVSLQGLQAALNLNFTKKPMRLKEPLGMLSKEIGDRRYVAEGYDGVMDEETLEVLGTRDYLLRTYRDLKASSDQTAGLALNLNYYATGDANPHVPEICWAGRGMNEAQCSRRVFEVPNVRRANGKVETLRVRMISFLPPGETENAERLKNVAYVFNVNGEYVATPQEVTSRFWKASNEYAFDTKIEVTVGGDKQYCSQDQAIAAVSDFLRAGLASIEGCLPDAPAAKASSEKQAGGAPEAVNSK